MADRDDHHTPEPSASPPANGVGARPGTPATGDLAELRELLIGADWDRVEQILTLLETPEGHANEVSKVIAEALAMRAARDDSVSKALSPTIDVALKESIERNPQGIVDAIFPVIGPAIRRAVADALQRTTQVINTTLEHSLTLRSVRWRLEALRTGRSFAEVVLSHTLLYRVEQVFLIHRENGLLLDHVTSSGVGSPGADMVSGMLTAIQDFVRDSFGVADGETLRTLTVGGLTIWMEQGPHALIAAVVRGRAPVQLRAHLQDALGAIHLEQRETLREFNGDASPFVRSRHQLESCLVQEAAAPERKRPSIGTWLLLLLVGVAIGAWIFFAVRTGVRWRAYLEALDDAPGLVVTDHHRGFWTMRVNGLRDALADDPEALIEAHRLDPDRVRGTWHDFQSLEPEVVLRRAGALLDPPGSVTLRLDPERRLSATGDADPAWAARARTVAPTIGGIDAYDERGLRFMDLDTLILEEAMRRLEPPETVTLSVRDRVLRASGPASVVWIDRAASVAPELEHLREYDGSGLVDERQIAFDQLVGRIQTTDIRFLSGVAMDEASTDLPARVAADLLTLEPLASALGVELIVHVVGHADPSGSVEINQEVSERRAAFVAEELVARGVTRERLAPIGIGSREARPDASDRPLLSRRVSFVIEHVGAFGS